ncbi:tRNA pseudouridine(38/39) synthase isoform X2 [Musca domestica]|uniref:tRNA pseudouridine(38/39) synthase n=1 Tax=Musca domestica TaxID=7370 RepID=A0A1I8N500_MUSDO|nr:tRNA pseudouridine(38/39) synthase isoform X2 [Musca domestica]XP_011296570.1 tRNA pseudouridine(38/39) synthase isoform X2 [Musca domestica]XP_011296571.1 tRNA pseudouridine(38/39) synthase isoform X2 [Musca domestica]
MSSKIQINKRVKGLPREELEKLSKTELIDKIIQLEAYNFQLKNIFNKKLDENDDDLRDELKELNQLNDQCKTEKPEDVNKKNAIEDSTEGSPENPNAVGNKKNKKREFDFSKCHKRHVLMKFLYFGWDYQGYACQEDSNATIEYHLFRALTRACLIESRNSSNYHRCGRTDKEVSAFCQVISIDLRSKFPPEEQYEEDSLKNEIDYCGLLNRILPKNIQCIAWMPLRSPVYSARFDCVARTYRYYFPKGDLNIEAMQKACKLLQIHGDFRNFCKMDVHNGVTNYIRNLQAANVLPCPNVQDEQRQGYSMYFLEIKANAFLWHQIRCIMAVLLLIGQEKEEPEVITELLDVEKNPCKPQYTPAIGLPLNLFNCEFREKTCRRTDEELAMAAQTDDIVPPQEEIMDIDSTPDTSPWIYNEENLQKLIENVQSEWTQFSIKSTMIRNVLHNLETLLDEQFKPQAVQSQVLLLQDGVKPRQYQKLLTRKRCESLENRIEHFVKKQRLIVN